MQVCKIRLITGLYKPAEVKMFYVVHRDDGTDCIDICCDAPPLKKALQTALDGLELQRDIFESEINELIGAHDAWLNGLDGGTVKEDMESHTAALLQVQQAAAVIKTLMLRL